MTFGTLLRRQRIAAGWTLRAFASMIGVSEPYLSLVERDMKPPMPSHLIGIAADCLGVDRGPLLSLAHVARARLSLLPPERRQFVQSIIIQVASMTDEEYAAFVSRL